MNALARRRRPGGLRAPNTLALSFLDIVSAGFGGAVFLFIVFASLPPEVPQSDETGQSRFLDISLEWQCDCARPTGTGGSEALDEKIWTRWTEFVRTRQPYKSTALSHSTWSLARRWLGSLDTYVKLRSAALRNEVKWAAVNASWRQFTDVWDKLPTYVKPESRSEVHAEVVGILEVLIRAQEKMDLDVSTVRDGTQREPLVAVDLRHIAPGGQVTDVSTSGGGTVDSRTDRFRSKVPGLWQSAHVTGHDWFGQYRTVSPSDVRTLDVRISDPAPGTWHVFARVFNARSYADAGPPPSLTLNGTVLCSTRVGEPAHREEVEARLEGGWEATVRQVELADAPCTFEDEAR